MDLGVGKTTIARLLPRICINIPLFLNEILFKNSVCIVNYHFWAFNPIEEGVNEIRKGLLKAKNLKNLSRRSTILFIDEIHRFEIFTVYKTFQKKKKLISFLF
jgi:replication-associated recombination protein RarA